MNTTTTTKITTEQILETARQKIEYWLTNNSDDVIYNLDDDENEIEDEIIYCSSVQDFTINKVELDEDNQDSDEENIAGKVFITLDWIQEKEYLETDNTYRESEENVIFSAIVRIDHDGSLYVDETEIEREN